MPRVARQLGGIQANSAESAASKRKSKKEQIKSSKRKQSSAAAGKDAVGGEYPGKETHEADEVSKWDATVPNDAEEKKANRILRNRQSAEKSRREQHQKVTVMEAKRAKLEKLDGELSQVLDELSAFAGGKPS